MHLPAHSHSHSVSFYFLCYEVIKLRCTPHPHSLVARRTCSNIQEVLCNSFFYVTEFFDRFITI